MLCARILKQDSHYLIFIENEKETVDIIEVGKLKFIKKYREKNRNLKRGAKKDENSTDR